MSAAGTGSSVYGNRYGQGESAISPTGHEIYEKTQPISELPGCPVTAKCDIIEEVDEKDPELF
jgi:hypothetical protein